MLDRYFNEITEDSPADNDISETKTFYSYVAITEKKYKA